MAPSRGANQRPPTVASATPPTQFSLIYTGGSVKTTVHCNVQSQKSKVQSLSSDSFATQTLDFGPLDFAFSLPTERQATETTIHLLKLGHRQSNGVEPLPTNRPLKVRITRRDQQSTVERHAVRRIFAACRNSDDIVVAQCGAISQRLDRYQPALAQVSETAFQMQHLI